MGNTQQARITNDGCHDNPTFPENYQDSSGDREMTDRGTIGSSRAHSEPDFEDYPVYPEHQTEKRVVVDRRVLSQDDFDAKYCIGTLSPNTKEKIKLFFDETRQEMKCTERRAKKYFMQYFPFIQIFRKYQVKKWITDDIISGLTVGIMNIPQGMAYALLATLPPVIGLYTSFFPVIVYFFFGTSRQAALGTSAVPSLLTGISLTARVLTHFNQSYASGNLTSNGSTTLTEPADVTAFRIQAAITLTLLMGIIQLALGLLRLGFIVRYMSDSMISGFTMGCAIQVFNSQLKTIFGVKIPNVSGLYEVPMTIYWVCKMLPTTNLITMGISFVSIAILGFINKFVNIKLKTKCKVPIPIELMVVVAGTLVSNFLNLGPKYGVSIVGNIPQGIPVPEAPPASLMADTMGDAVVMAIVLFAISVSMEKVYAKKHGYEINASQEFVAHGFSNIFASFFHCFPASTSVSRTPVQDATGGKTQLVSLISSALVLMVLLFIGPYFKTVPNCCLASIIIVALASLFQEVSDVPKLWKFSQYDFWTWVVSCLSVIILSVEYGLAIGVGFSFLTVIVRTQSPSHQILGNINGTELYKYRDHYNVREIPGIKIFRYEGSLYYCSRQHFQDSIYTETGCNPRKVMRARKKLESAKKKQAKKDLKITKKNKGITTDEIVQESNQNGTKPEEHPETNVEHKDSMQMPNGKIVPGMFNDSIRKAKTSVVHFAEPDVEKKVFPEDLPFHHLIIECSAWSYMDNSGISILNTVIEEYKSIGITVLLANLKTAVREKFKKCYFEVSHNGGEIVFQSVHDAVLAAIFEHRNLYEMQTYGHTVCCADDYDPVPYETDHDGKSIEPITEVGTLAGTVITTSKF